MVYSDAENGWCTQMQKKEVSPASLSAALLDASLSRPGPDALSKVSTSNGKVN